MTALAGKNIIILGGTGTLGKAITSCIIKEYTDIQSLTIFSRDEVKQLEMMEEFSQTSCKIDYLLGDVRDVDRLNEVLQGMDFVVHAAAIKHVVMAERNPEECYKTNVLGSQNVVDACLSQEVDKALLISTDKAVNPEGVYGWSKYQAEQLFIDANTDRGCQFKVIRFGNIVGSRGSVWETFSKQRETGILKVTHAEATRFYIEQEEAASFVISKLSEMKNEREISSPEMNAIRILDLARSMAPECKIEFTGLRKGDKLHEELDGVSSEECFLEKKLAAR